MVITEEQAELLIGWLERKKGEAEREAAYWARKNKPRQEYYAMGTAFGYDNTLRQLRGLASSLSATTKEGE